VLPHFVIIGAQKAGTTSLWFYLARHPQIFMSELKETNFFIAERAWPNGLDWYESLFSEAAKTGMLTGEASPNYTFYPGFQGIPERMSQVIPQARLIYLLRHPVERMISGYLNGLTLGQEHLPIQQALFERPQYADTSRYAMQIEQYLQYFDRSQLLVLLSEDLERRPAETIDRILDFLGLETGWRHPSFETRHHRTAGKRVPRWWWRRLGGLVIRGRIPVFPVPKAAVSSPVTTRALRPRDSALQATARRRLEDMVRPDVERLSRYMDDGFHGWGLLDD